MVDENASYPPVRPVIFALHNPYPACYRQLPREPTELTLA
ncbi:hypothetical protein HRUBRA_00962 [Pseudohaliea rubra DSM 19751]|uniref:Uncharacterized protein n=1 Tax=Pseudohaliea rubra DSM 19751 TaxID=1265313 RepID=A0A095VSJ6_9GAMM|nr:hypothetical protein HRUBRA_00962 [Pseudohaliea rubra DSM 19751]